MFVSKIILEYFVYHADAHTINKFSIQTNRDNQSNKKKQYVNSVSIFMIEFSSKNITMFNVWMSWFIVSQTQWRAWMPELVTGDCALCYIPIIMLREKFKSVTEDQFSLHRIIQPNRIAPNLNNKWQFHF